MLRSSAVFGSMLVLASSFSSCAGPSWWTSKKAGPQSFYGGHSSTVPVNAFTYNLTWTGGQAEWSSNCADGYVGFTNEVTNRQCTTSVSVNSNTLTIQVTNCQTYFPANTSFGTMLLCYKPTGGVPNAGLATLTGNCTAGVDSCVFYSVSTIVANVAQRTDIPGTVASNNDQRRVGQLLLTPDTVLNWTNFDIGHSGSALKFADTSNTACCTALTGSSSGCPHTGGNVKRFLPVAGFPAGCVIETDIWVGSPGNEIFGKVSCSSGLDFVGFTDEPLVKFCYYGDTPGNDTVIGTGSSAPQVGVGGLSTYFQSKDITVTN